MEIQIKDDLDLDRIADSGQCFRWVKEESGAYRILHRDHILRIRDLGDGEFWLSCTEEEYRDVWYDYFDFGTRYRSVRRRILKRTTPFCTPPAIPERESGFLSRMPGRCW